MSSYKYWKVTVWVDGNQTDSIIVGGSNYLEAEEEAQDRLPPPMVDYVAEEATEDELREYFDNIGVPVT